MDKLQSIRKLNGEIAIDMVNSLTDAIPAHKRYSLYEQYLTRVSSYNQQLTDNIIYAHGTKVLNTKGKLTARYARQLLREPTYEDFVAIDLRIIVINKLLTTEYAYLFENLYDSDICKLFSIDYSALKQLLREAMHHVKEYALSPYYGHYDDTMEAYNYLLSLQTNDPNSNSTVIEEAL